MVQLHHANSAYNPQFKEATVLGGGNIGFLTFSIPAGHTLVICENAKIHYDRKIFRNHEIERVAILETYTGIDRNHFTQTYHLWNNNTFQYLATIHTELRFTIYSTPLPPEKVVYSFDPSSIIVHCSKTTNFRICEKRTFTLDRFTNKK